MVWAVDEFIDKSTEFDWDEGDGGETVVRVQCVDILKNPMWSAHCLSTV